MWRIQGRYVHSLFGWEYYWWINDATGADHYTYIPWFWRGESVEAVTALLQLKPIRSGSV